jgi:hypothetical protein
MIVHAQQVGQLPPSGRDFQVFERVVVEGATTRAAAAEFALSQTRIVQVRDRVAEWIAAEVPTIERLSPRERLRLAERIASQRIDYLYSLALEAWRASQGEETIVRAGEVGLSRITRTSHGEPKYLAIAARLSLRQIEVARGQETGNRGQETEDSRGQRACASIYTEHTSAPPVEECSRSAALSVIAPPALIDEGDVSPCRPAMSDDIESRRRAFLAALADDTSPVQPPVVDAAGMLIDESPARRAEQPLAAILQLDLDPEQPGATAAVERPLTREQRRARQRLLERKLRAKAK